MKLKELLDKYPKIFDVNYGRKDWIIPATWVGLVDRMCQEIQSFHDLYPDLDQVKCTQMKEKFGTLRFYTDFTTPRVYDIIGSYENLSSGICQECGCEHCNTYPTESGWIKYLCQPCAAKLNRPLRTYVD